MVTDMKKLDRILNTIIGVFVGIIIGHGIHVFWDHKTYPELDAMRSAPWYTSILVYGIATAAVLAIAIIIKLIIRRRSKRR